MQLAERNALIVRNIPLARLIAAEFFEPARIAGLTHEEVYSAAAMGLIHAANRYDPMRGRFVSLARVWCRGTIRRELKLLRPRAVTGLDLLGVVDHRPAPVPSLEPLFPVPALTPSSECPHVGPMTSTLFVCGVCWASKWDGHPDMQVSRAERARRRGRRDAAAIPVPKIEKLTRRQKRDNRFGRAS